MNAARDTQAPPQQLQADFYQLAGVRHEEERHDKYRTQQESLFSSTFSVFSIKLSRPHKSQN
jgi:hypothetical protein